jgi:hypothetical protein
VFNIFLIAFSQTKPRLPDGAHGFEGIVYRDFSFRKFIIQNDDIGFSDTVV